MLSGLRQGCDDNGQVRQGLSNRLLHLGLHLLHLRAQRLRLLLQDQGPAQDGGQSPPQALSQHAVSATGGHLRHQQGAGGYGQCLSLALSVFLVAIGPGIDSAQRQPQLARQLSQGQQGLALRPGQLTHTGRPRCRTSHPHLFDRAQAHRLDRTACHGLPPRSTDRRNTRFSHRRHPRRQDQLQRAGQALERLHLSPPAAQHPGALVPQHKIHRLIQPWRRVQINTQHFAHHFNESRQSGCDPRPC